jgi:hypothetical protein
MTKMENNRFTSECIGRYSAEHDSADNSLRLSWSGDQLFMSEDEARVLLAFLQQLYPFEEYHLNIQGRQSPRASVKEWKKLFSPLTFCAP